MNLYVYTGAAGRIANKYTYEDGAHVEIPEDDRSKTLLRNIRKSLVIYHLHTEDDFIFII